MVLTSMDGSLSSPKTIVEGRGGMCMYTQSRNTKYYSAHCFINQTPWLQFISSFSAVATK